MNLESKTIEKHFYTIYKKINLTLFTRKHIFYPRNNNSLLKLYNLIWHNKKLNYIVE